MKRKGIAMISVIFGVLSLLVFAIMLPVVIQAIDWGNEGIYQATNTTEGEETGYEATQLIFNLIPFVIVTMILFGLIEVRDETGF